MGPNAATGWTDTEARAAITIDDAVRDDIFVLIYLGFPLNGLEDDTKEGPRSEATCNPCAHVARPSERSASEGGAASRSPGFRHVRATYEEIRVLRKINPVRQSGLEAAQTQQCKIDRRDLPSKTIAPSLLGTMLPRTVQNETMLLPKDTHGESPVKVVLVATGC